MALSIPSHLYPTLYQICGASLCDESSQIARCMFRRPTQWGVSAVSCCLREASPAPGAVLVLFGVRLAGEIQRHVLAGLCLRNTQAQLGSS